MTLKKSLLCYANYASFRRQLRGGAGPYGEGCLLPTGKESEEGVKNFSFGGSRSFKVVDVDKSKKPVTSACYDKQPSVPICNRFHATRANSGKITTSYEGSRF